MPDPKTLPTGHPDIPDDKIGVLIANLGTPDGYDYWPMRRYLNEFLLDRRVVDYPRWKWVPLVKLIILSKRPFTSGRAYKSIWNEKDDESPLLTITKAQHRKLSAGLADRYGDKVMVEYCMRYGNPSTRTTLRRMVAAGCQRILFFPLYPHYAGPTTATANDELFRALMQEKWQPAVRTVPAYYDRPGYIEALARSVEQVWADMAVKPDVLVASYHGVPQRYLTEGDPYHCHCQKTSRLLKERLGLDDDSFVTTFQSRFGPEEWLQPYTVEEVARLAQAGKKNIAVMAPAFASDCIETLEEIQEEIREAFLHAGGETFTYIPCLNDDDTHIAVLTEIIEENLAGWLD